MKVNSNKLSGENLPFYKRKWFVLPVVAILVAITVDFLVVFMTHGGSMPLEVLSIQNSDREPVADQIKVMTINMAHGRSDGRNQLLQASSTIEKNVENIGDFIARERPQVVALQEADAPSWWSGRFSHVERVATVGGMTSAVQGRNVDGLGLHYGAAVVTELNVSEARQVTFKKNIPTFSKGFVVVTCAWPGDPDFKFDVVSLHLDFASAKVRTYQLSILSDLVRQSERPIVLMGDFNTDMVRELLPKFLEETGLQAWRVDDETTVTFPYLGTRIDWILASPELRMVEQSVLDDVLSDHKVVVAILEREDRE